MVMPKKQKKNLIKEMKSYFSQNNLNIYALDTSGSNMFNRVENVYETVEVDDSNVIDILKHILHNRAKEPEAFHHFFNYVDFSTTENIRNFFDKIKEENLIPKDVNKIIELIKETNNEVIINSDFYSQYLLRKTLSNILPKEYLEKLNETFADVLNEMKNKDIKPELSYKFTIDKYLFIENSNTQYPFHTNYTTYHKAIDELIIPIKNILGIELKNIRKVEYGAKEDVVELVFIGKDVNKYTEFVNYLTINLHNFLHEKNSDNEEKIKEMFLLKFTLEYETKEDCLQKNNLKSKI